MFDKLRFKLVPLKTIDECRAADEVIQVYVVELPPKQASKAIE
jgi:hypothetical protein